MADAAAQAIVHKALELAKLKPGRPAIEILDLAMEGHQGSAPDFSVRDSEAEAEILQRRFGELLRQAFAPRLDGATNGAPQLWQREVLERFADRYRLWQG